VGGALVSVPLNWQRFGKGWQRTLGLLGAAAVPALSLGVMFVELEPVVDEVKVRYYLAPTFKVAEEQAQKAWAYAIFLSRNWERPIDAGNVEDARQAFQTAQQILQDALDVFDQLGPYQQQEVVDAAARAKTYLEEWSKFYALFGKTIAAPPPWPQEQHAALVQQAESVAAAGNVLKNSPLFPAFASRLPSLQKNK
jgi:hypothetical protein